VQLAMIQIVFSALMTKQNVLYVKQAMCFLQLKHAINSQFVTSLDSSGPQPVLENAYHYTPVKWISVLLPLLEQIVPHHLQTNV